MYNYYLYEKSFKSDIILPIKQNEYLGTKKTIIIKKGIVDRYYKGKSYIGETSYNIGKNFVFVDVPFIARYLLKNSIITIEPLINEDDELIGIYLINFVFKFMLKEKSEIYFHGSAISINSKATILLGDKGAGKSTLAAALTNFKGKILCDDLIPMTKGPIIKPGISRLKLYEDSYQAISNGDEINSLYKDNQNKFHININSSNLKTKLNKIIIISKDYIDGVKIREIKGGEKLQFIIPHIIKINKIDTDINIYKQLIEYTKNIKVYSLTRPNGFIDPHLVAKEIIKLK